MKKLTITLFNLFLVYAGMAQVNCPEGYENRDVMCGGKIVTKCVPVNLKCNSCWKIEWATCDGSFKNSIWGKSFATYEECVQAADNARSHPWTKCINESKIFLNNANYCNSLITNPALVSDVRNKILPFLQRYLNEIQNFRRQYNGQRYQPGGASDEYEAVLNQAEENGRNLQTMVNNMTEKNLAEVERTFDEIQKDEQKLQQKESSYRNQISENNLKETNRRENQRKIDENKKKQDQLQKEITNIKKETDRRRKANQELGDVIREGIQGIADRLEQDRQKKAAQFKEKRNREKIEELQKQNNELEQQSLEGAIQNPVVKNEGIIEPVSQKTEQTDSELEDYQAALAQHGDDLLKELNYKDSVFINDSSNLSPMMKEIKRKELIDLYQRVQGWNQQSQEMYNKKALENHTIQTSNDERTSANPSLKKSEQVASELTNYQIALVDQGNELYKELNEKDSLFVRDSSNLSPMMKEIKRKELIEIYQRVQGWNEHSKEMYNRKAFEKYTSLKTTGENIRINKGYIDLNKLLMWMADGKGDSELKDYQAALVQQGKDLYKELIEKDNVFVRDSSRLSPSTKETQRNILIDLYQRVKGWDQYSLEMYVKKIQEKYPSFKIKAMDAIKLVTNEYGFSKVYFIEANEEINETSDINLFLFVKDYLNNPK